MDSQKSNFQNPQFMLILSANCNAECSYCFGPHKGKITSKHVINNSIKFIEKISAESNQEKINITFHGGEPLIAPISLWTFTLEKLISAFRNKQLSLSVQSNLWNLNDNFCRLFKKYNISIGTSLDGPKEVNDKQRGKGYFEKTFKGIDLASKHGLDVGCISTFTPVNLYKWKDIMGFFKSEKISFSVHPSIRPLNCTNNDDLFLNSVQYGFLLSSMLKEYLKNRKHIKIDSLDQYCRSVAFGHGEVCTFRDCFGMFIAIDPKGDIYPCQRFCGNKEFMIGNVLKMPSLVDIENHPNAEKIKNREKEVQKHCSDCKHYSYCKGGCYYNALSGGDGIIDPFCQAYLHTFENILEKLLKEVSSKRNTEAMLKADYQRDEFLHFQKGEIISLTKKIHPSVIGQNAKMVIALHEIAKSQELKESARYMVKNRFTFNEDKTFVALQQIKKSILVYNENSCLNNLYLHITFLCNLNCTHCYANAGIYGSSNYMNANDLLKLVSDSQKNNFRQTIITGGEPLIHPQITEILNGLKTLKKKGMNLILRTNLTGCYNDDFLTQMAQAFDQVVVSVDGDEIMHDQRRGQGSYSLMKDNICRFQKIVSLNSNNYAELSFASVMNLKDINGKSGESVKQLAYSVNVKRVRFRPLLPLGRAKDWNVPPTSETIFSHLDPISFLEKEINANLSCGIGQNLYVEPSGDSFPCYAFHKPHSLLGNVLINGLSEILTSPNFKKLSYYNVERIDKCRNCDYRYLCGGACRAWGGEHSQFRLDAPPIECEGLRNRAKEIVEAAKCYLLQK